MLKKYPNTTATTNTTAAAKALANVGQEPTFSISKPCSFSKSSCTSRSFNSDNFILRPPLHQETLASRLIQKLYGRHPRWKHWTRLAGQTKGKRSYYALTLR